MKCCYDSCEMCDVQGKFLITFSFFLFFFFYILVRQMFHDSMNVVSIPIAKVINELRERGTRGSHVQPLERQTNADRAIRRKIQQTQIFILEIRLGGTRFRGSRYHLPTDSTSLSHIYRSNIEIFVVTS